MKKVNSKSVGNYSDHSGFIEGLGEYPVLYYPRVRNERWIKFQWRTFLLDWEIHREYKKSAGIKLLAVRIGDRLEQF